MSSQTLLPSKRYWTPSTLRHSASTSFTSSSISPSSTGLSSASSASSHNPLSESTSANIGHRRQRSDVVGCTEIPLGKTLKVSPSMTFSREGVTTQSTRDLENIPIQSLRRINLPTNKSTSQSTSTPTARIKKSNLLSRSSEMFKSRWLPFGKTMTVEKSRIERGDIGEVYLEEQEGSKGFEGDEIDISPLRNLEEQFSIKDGITRETGLVVESITTASSVQSVSNHSIRLNIHLPSLDSHNPASPLFPPTSSIKTHPSTTCKTSPPIDNTTPTITLTPSTKTVTTAISGSSSPSPITPPPITQSLHPSSSISFQSDSESSVDHELSDVSTEMEMEMEIVGLVELSEVFVGGFGEKEMRDLSVREGSEVELVEEEGVDLERRSGSLDEGATHLDEGKVEIGDEGPDIQDMELPIIEEQSRSHLAETLRSIVPPSNPTSVPSVTITDYSTTTTTTSSSSPTPSTPIIPFSESSDAESTIYTEISSDNDPVLDSGDEPWTTKESGGYDEAQQTQDVKMVKNAKEDEFPLSHPWTMLFANTSRTCTPRPSTPLALYTGPGYENGLFEIFSAQTVESFVTGWVTYRSGIDRLVSSGGGGAGVGSVIGLGIERLGAEQTVHCFRNGVLPLWEDEMCKRGGRLSIQTPYENLDLIFDAIVWLIVGSDLDTPTSSTICGISAIRKDHGPRGLASRIDVWIGGPGDVSYEEACIIRQALVDKCEMKEIREARWKKF